MTSGKWFYSDGDFYISRVCMKKAPAWALTVQEHHSNVKGVSYA